MAVGEQDLALALDDEAELAEIDALDPLDVLRVMPVEIIGLGSSAPSALRNSICGRGSRSFSAAGWAGFILVAPRIYALSIRDSCLPGFLIF